MPYTFLNNAYICIPKDDPQDRLQVEIGDSKGLDFCPQIKIMRWDNEINFSARLVHEQTAPMLSAAADLVTWQGKTIACKWYPVLDGDGGHEFEVILTEPPKSNILRFTIQAKNLLFFHQAPLANLNPDDSTWENNHRGGISYRPANVNGSYAVYHASAPINTAGGKKYECGKAFHIYRPRIVDATGKQAWGELRIDEVAGILTVTIPQDFLDNAVYPIRHAAGLTLGYTTRGASSDYCASGYVWAINAGAADSDGTASKVSIYARVASGSLTLKMGFWSDTSGLPDAFVGGDATGITIDNTSFPAQGSPADSNAISGTVINGTTYWVGCVIEEAGKSVYIAYDTGPSNIQRYKSGTYTTLPSPFPSSPTGSTVKQSVFVTYEAAAGGATTVAKHRGPYMVGMMHGMRKPGMQ